MFPKHSTVAAIERAAHTIGAEAFVDEFGRCGLIRFPNGKTTLFHYNRLNLNGVASARIAQDKVYTTNMLRFLGHRVPDEKVFFSPGFARRLGAEQSIEDACSYASAIGWPVIVKPTRLSQGTMVSLVFGEAELRHTADTILATTSAMVVQRRYCGNDYRIVTLDDEVICAYERTPLSVRGDGQSSIADLLDEKQRKFCAEGRDTIIPTGDPRLLERLSRIGLSLSSVPAADDVVRLLEIANLSTGGESVDVLEKLHPSFARLACAAARDMQLRLCGVDLIADDITTDANGQQYVIIELNSAPGLDNYLMTGDDQQEYVTNLYAKLLSALMSS